jgi:hypothetical protein
MSASPMWTWAGFTVLILVLLVLDMLVDGSPTGRQRVE